MSAGGSASGRPPSTAPSGTRTASRRSAPGSPGSGTARTRDRPSRMPRCRPTSRSPPARHAPSRRRRPHAERRQLVARLEERLGIGSTEIGQRVERPAVLDRGQDVVELAVVRGRVVDVVGDDDRQPELRGERHRFGDEPVVVGQQVVRELDEEAARRTARRHARRSRRSAAPPPWRPPGRRPAAGGRSPRRDNPTVR